MNHLRVDFDDGRAVAQPTATEITANTARAMFAELRELGSESKAILLDCESVTLIDSTGIGELVQCHKHLRGAGAVLAVCGLAPHLQELVRMMRLERLMDFIPDRNAGLERLRTIA